MLSREGAIRVLIVIAGIATIASVASYSEDYIYHVHGPRQYGRAGAGPRQYGRAGAGPLQYGRAGPEHFTPEADRSSIVDAFVRLTGELPTQDEADRVFRAISVGEGKDVGSAIETVLTEVFSKTDTSISFGEESWNFQRHGSGGTLRVPFKMSALSANATSIRMIGGTGAFIESLRVKLNGALTDIKLSKSDKGIYEAIIPGDCDGDVNISFLKARDVMVMFINGTASSGKIARVKKTTLPSSGMSSDTVEIAPPERDSNIVRVSFNIKKPSEAAKEVKLVIRAPEDSTFVESITPGKDVVRTGQSEWSTEFPPGTAAGTITLYQMGGALPAFEAWVLYDNQTASVSVPAGSHRHVGLVDQDTVDAPSLPSVRPVEKNPIDWIGNPIEYIAGAKDDAVVFGTPRSSGKSITAPFHVDIAGTGAGGGSIALDWEAKSDLSRVTGLDVGGMKLAPQEGSNAIYARLPAGRHAGRVLIENKGGVAPVKLVLTAEGRSSSVTVGASSRSDGRRFENVYPHRSHAELADVQLADQSASAVQRVVAFFTDKVGREPDEKTAAYLSSAYIRWGGDMPRVASLIATISAMVGADSGDMASAAVKKGVEALISGGVEPGDASRALKDWKEYRDHILSTEFERPNVNSAGATALKRPWGGTAAVLAAGTPVNGAPAAPSNSLDPDDAYPLVGAGRDEK